MSSMNAKLTATNMIKKNVKMFGQFLMMIIYEMFCVVKTKNTRIFLFVLCMFDDERHAMITQKKVIFFLSRLNMDGFKLVCRVVCCCCCTILIDNLLVCCSRWICVIKNEIFFFLKSSKIVVYLLRLYIFVNLTFFEICKLIFQFFHSFIC